MIPLDTFWWLELWNQIYIFWFNFGLSAITSEVRTEVSSHPLNNQRVSTKEKGLICNDRSLMWLFTWTAGTVFRPTSPLENDWLNSTSQQAAKICRIRFFRGFSVGNCIIQIASALADRDLAFSQTRPDVFESLSKDNKRVLLVLEHSLEFRAALPGKFHPPKLQGLL